jgi:hypothetical protein
MSGPQRIAATAVAGYDEEDRTHMLIQPIDYFLVAWFALALASTGYVGWDQYRNNPEPEVMKWGFILITLYMGPLGLLLYVLADKEPRPGEHETFIAPLWKQGVGSTIHCIAGDATGIILAAAVTATLGLPMWIDLIVEYVAGFAFGLFIFQSLFMQFMMGGTYWENRGGPAFSDSFRGPDKWNSAAHAAAAIGIGLKYTVSGVLRSSD